MMTCTKYLSYFLPFLLILKCCFVVATILIVQKHLNNPYEDSTQTCVLQYKAADIINNCSLQLLLSFFSIMLAVCACVRISFIYALLYIFWIVGTSTITYGTVVANSHNVPQEYWRNVVVALDWTIVCIIIAVIVVEYTLKIYEPQIQIETIQLPSQNLNCEEHVVVYITPKEHRHT